MIKKSTQLYKRKTAIPCYRGLYVGHYLKRIPVPEHIEPELEKIGFWSRFFKPYG